MSVTSISSPLARASEFPSREERAKRLKARGDDPEFNEVVTQAERNLETKLIERVYNVDMIPNGPYTAIKITAING